MVVTLAPGEECEGYAFGLYVCMYVSMDGQLKNYCSDLLVFFHPRSVIPVARCSSKMIRIRSGLKNLFKDSSPLGDRTKYSTTLNVRQYENMRYDVICAS